MAIQCVGLLRFELPSALWAYDLVVNSSTPSLPHRGEPTSGALASMSSSASSGSATPAAAAPAAPVRTYSGAEAAEDGERLKCQHKKSLDVSCMQPLSRRASISVFQRVRFAGCCAMVLVCICACLL